MARLCVWLAIIVVTSSASSGCESDGNATVRKFLGWDDSKMPSMENFPKPNIEVASRVHDIGNRMIQLSTFPGIDPFFHTIGVPESVLFHRGPNDLFISEGLAKQCKTDPELAAVIASELGQMIAEKNAVRRVAAERDMIPDVALPGSGQTMTGGGTPFDATRRAELGYAQNQPRSSPKPDPVDAAKQAKNLLTAAGYEPTILDQVQPLLKQSDRGWKIQKQMSGSSPPPEWKP